ncbi:hypothetical protein CI109_101636 [Kwoniella shandongensis]|uniref:Uncharacterized protein n=1 Tax=Kwoniella shandongensis TaxID=1734106 RepID=A0A5M6C5M3_9TREE|nr:uncharacterized protein CI109_001239 [Kwoniella shandongensis]KAA5530436.1 hypothetical protein CI109_001239 [Kwoniella shandongensis]
MTQIALTPEQSARLQSEIQGELERREWAEPDDNVMAEYITVLLANGSARDRVQSEMDDLVGSDFDPAFLDWLFSKAIEVSTAPAAAEASPVNSNSAVSTQRPAGSRLLNTALAPLASQPVEKRKFSDSGADAQNKKRLSDVGGAPSGPRAGNEGRGLADRIGPGPGPGRGRGGMPIRGVAGGPGRGGFGHNQRGPMGGFQPGFRPQMMQQGFGAPFMAPGQQEMMAQMMMMQANMAQMGEMMSKMAEEREALQQHQQRAQQPTVRPARPPAPVKVPHGTKLGAHSVSAIPPKTNSTPGPIPDKPSSNALCRYSIGCSNSRCPYSHPSPVADEKTGMVLSEEPCENGKNCKDAECIKSHVSPAASLGETAGPSRLLCKYQNCTNPSCPFRHEDASGNPIPPPALTASKTAKKAVDLPAHSSDNEDGEMEVVMSSKGLMDGALEDTRKEVSCRYGERCTRADCKFSHPASRPTPKSYLAGKKSFPSRSTSSTFNKSATTNGSGGIGGGMHASKKFGTNGATEKKLDPTVGEFKPGGAVENKELEVTI